MDEKKVLGDDTAFEPVGRVDCSGDGNVHQRSSTMDSSNLNLKDSHKEEAPNSDYVCNEEKRRQKINRILLAVKLRNYDEVASLATSHGGFIEDETRRVVCTYSGSEQAIWTILLSNLLIYYILIAFRAFSARLSSTNR